MGNRENWGKVGLAVEPWFGKFFKRAILRKFPLFLRKKTLIFVKKLCALIFSQAKENACCNIINR